MTENNVTALAEALRVNLGASGHAVVQELLALWPAPDATRDKIRGSCSLPVLSYLDSACANAPADQAAAAKALRAAAPAMVWGQTYSEADLDRSFLDRYGWAAVVGPQAPVHSDRLLSGFLLLGPGIEYPYHKHSAEEVYRVVSGTASWRLGDEDWVPLPPGSIVHNPPWRPHGMRTDHGEPLLLAYLWQAGTIEKSIMV